MLSFTSCFIARQGHSNLSDERLRAEMEMAAVMLHRGGGDDEDLGRKRNLVKDEAEISLVGY